jgi:hypothetical protein
LSGIIFRLIKRDEEFPGRDGPAVGLAAFGAAFDFIFLHGENLAAGTGNFYLSHLSLPLFQKN